MSRTKARREECRQIATDYVEKVTLVLDWHETHLGCDCGPETADADFCPASVAWADEEYSALPGSSIEGDPDPWGHDSWVQAWGRNVPLIVGPYDDAYRIPSAPEGMTLLVSRSTVGGQCAVELVLSREGGPRVDFARVCAEPSTVAARARKMIRDAVVS